MLKNAFEELEFVRVQFTANALNAQSRAGIEKIGGTFEGILRNAMILPDGSLRDDLYFSIIAAEWPLVREKIIFRIKEKAAAKK